MADVTKILCAIDFSEASSQVFDYAKTLASCTNAKLTVVYVAPSLSQYVGFHVPPSSIDSFVKEIVEGADKSMDDFLKENAAGLDVKGRVVTGYAAEEITKAAEEENADMIVMGTHGRTGIDKILFGSVAEKVVKTSACPVLTVRPAYKS
jgi:nucleotide-binding universal stress UspA family protein